MKLLIDFGNSRVKWACFDGQDVIDAKAYSYENEDITQRVNDVAEQIDTDSVQEIHAVSVLGESFNQAFHARLNKHANISTQFYVSQLNKFGVTLAYADPLSYGADRYAALIAAHDKSDNATIVIDCGTATTIDAIDKSGKHLGGLIIPGITLMCSSLASKASGINMPNTTNSVQLLSDNTLDAVYSGSALVLRHGVSAIVSEMTSEINQQVSIYVTGGESHHLASSSYIDCPHLVLDGLRIMQGS
ncbi:MAG: type III pantothenate kinase [Gammaproteobacteria bacterium]